MSERAEKVILNPSEVATAGRTEVDLHSGSILVDQKGIDWGDQEIEAFMSRGVLGQKPIDYDTPNRVIAIPMIIGATGDFDAARILLQAEVGRINEEGCWLKREIIGGSYGEAGGHLFADVVKATLKLGDETVQASEGFDPNAELILEALPDFYGDEIVEAAHEFTGDGSFTMQVNGDLPARVTNIKVEDLSGNNQLGLMWHFRRRNYSSADTAEWAYNAEALGLLDLAEKVTLTGSYGTKAVKHPKLSTEWTPVLSTNKAGTTFLTHTGLYTVWARVYSASPVLPWLRLSYGVGDVVTPQENRQVRVPGVEAFYLVNLGQVNIQALPFGAQRWEGVIQARGEAGGENISIDRLWFQCADESSGVLAALTSSTSLSSILASDSLTGAGALGGSEAVRGGAWEESGETEGFTRSSEGTKRTHKSDTEGRTALLSGSTVGPVIVKAELARTGSAAGLTQAVYLRYFSSTYLVRVDFVVGATTTEVFLSYKAGGGLKGNFIGSFPLAAGFLPIEAEINAAAEVTVRAGGVKMGGYFVPSIFRKGEAQAEGKVGIFDYNPPSDTASSRTYRYFTATPLPVGDAVMYANRAAYLATNGLFRVSEDGNGVGPIGYPGADLPRLPVSGPEATPVEVAVKPSRGQFGEVADSGKDKFKVQVAYRPCYAAIPGS